MKERLIKKLLKQKGVPLFINRHTGKIYPNFNFKKTKWYQFNLEMYEKILQQI